MCFKSEQTENRGTDVTGIPKNTPSTLNLNIGSHTHQSVRAAARNEFSAPVESDPKLNLGLEEAFLKACSEMGAEFKQLPDALPVCTFNRADYFATAVSSQALKSSPSVL